MNLNYKLIHLLLLDVKIEDIQEFMDKFLSNMFMEALVYGNIDKSVSA